jgi:hypothetical protein
MSGVDRYAFAPLLDGGLLLDLDSGGLFELNRTAAFVWRQFLDGVGRETIVSAIAERHGVDVIRARADVASALAPTSSLAPTPLGDFEFRRTNTGYVQLFRGTPELELDASGSVLTVMLPPSARRPGRMNNSLRALVPKILSLRGHTVFHASAVLTRGRLLMFSGRSGAGKTTTARALADRGATLVSEDKLLVHADGDVIAWSGAERRIEAWVAQGTRSLLTEECISCVELDEAASGEKLQIAEIGFLDVVPRQGNQLVARRMTVQEVASASFRGMFLGTALAAGWRRQLGVAATFAQAVAGYAATMPDGLLALGLAAEILERRGTLGD